MASGFRSVRLVEGLFFIVVYIAVLSMSLHACIHGFVMILPYLCTYVVVYPQYST